MRAISNKRRYALFAFGSVLATGGFLATGFVACSNSSSTPTPGATDATIDTGSQQIGTISMTLPDGAVESLQSFPLGGPPDPGANAVYVTISGEANAITAYPFPPDNFNPGTQDTWMVDGWTFQIQAYIVVVDNVTLWSNPNVNPGNQSQHGAPVAHLNGPFVVDLHKGGKLIGAGGAPEQATPIGVLANQNDIGGAAFDPTQTYAFGFSTVPATYQTPSNALNPNAIPYNVNLSADEASYYNLMVQNGYSVLYVGSATWTGSRSPYGCTQTNAGAGPDAGLVDGGDAGVVTYVDGGYDFTKMPQTMTFQLGFSTPTNYVNCQNQLLPGQGVNGEDHPRGIQTSPSASALAQVTLHMDHPFWESFAENSPVHWDQIAAQYVGETGAEAHIEDMKGVPFWAFTDKTGTPVPWRNCSGSLYTPAGSGQMWFNTTGVSYNQGTNPATTIRDYYDYIRHTQSTQGHLNSQGLCYITRQFPDPGGGS